MTDASTIRKGTPADLPEISRLLGGREIPRVTAGRQYLLVLDAPDGRGLAAAALLAVQHQRAQLAMLVVDIRYQATGLEQRMIGVAEALSRAFGARSVDVRV